MLDSEDAYFFKFLGGLSFIKPDQPIEAPGSSRLLAVSSKYGITAFSDLTGEFAAQALLGLGCNICDTSLEPDLWISCCHRRVRRQDG